MTATFNQSKSKLNLPALVGVVLVLAGAFVIAFGAELLPNLLGGLVLGSGAICLASGALIMQQKLSGAWLYLIAAVYTFAWVLAAGPVHPGRIFTHLWFVLALGLLVSVSALQLFSRNGNRASRTGVLIAALANVGLLAFSALQ